MPGTLRWGILGPGGIAETFTKDLVGAGYRVTAVGSRSEDRARAFADQFDIPTVHGSYDALVADPEVDIVYVATPHSAHYEHARLALEAGKHVLVEKAFTVTEEQAGILTRIAEDAGLVVVEAMWSRYLPHMVRIRQIIAEGTIGDLRLVTADHEQRLPTDPQHRIQNPTLAGGALLDLGIYPVSFIWDMLGQPSAIHATGSMTETGVDRQVSAIFDYPGGAQGIVSMALDAPGPNRATVVGTDGWIDIERTWYASTSFTVYDTDAVELERYTDSFEHRGMQFQAAEVERLVDAGLTHGEILPPSESTAIMGSMDEIRRQIGLDYPADILGT